MKNIINRSASSRTKGTLSCTSQIFHCYLCPTGAWRLILSMLRRIYSLIIALLIVIPLFITSAEAIDFSQNPFEIYDKQREITLKNSVSEKTAPTNTLTQINTYSSGGLENKGKEYLVKFKEEILLSDIYDIVKNYSFSLIADSEIRLFWLIIKNYDEFMDDYGFTVKYIEENKNREVAAITDDPYLSQAWGYESMGIYKAWNYTFGKNSVVVAVLDTGIERNHEDFEGTKILSGYDMLTKKTVTNDLVGHGTAVSGLIAATSNNGKGSAGVSPGVTIMPIKVSNSREMANKDIIAGIYFAVDAGAKVINMSLGGYESSIIEEDAINYALNKGCILVAAAGNITTSGLDGYKSYPASYEGVISVGSTGKNGIISNTSQHNEALDVVAPGVDIIVMSYNNGKSDYKSDGGTSYSCAFISGIAALAASYIDDLKKIGSKELISLIKNTGKNWNEYYGYGVIDAEKILMLVNYPIVSGVSNGETYFESVVINFNRGTAKLDGSAITDGELVVENGQHTLVITDVNDYTRTIIFNVDNKPLTYSYVELSDYAYFTFDRGTATLDGAPYASGQRIIASGEFVFELSGKYSNSVSKRITLDFELPYVVGVIDGASYDTSVYIRIIGSGSAKLDGTSFSEETVVGSDGTHTLVVSNKSGSKTKTYTFKIENDAVKTYQSDLENGLAIVDPENKYIIQYASALKGIRVYNIDNPVYYNRFVGIGTVKGYDFYGSYLLTYHDNKITKLVRDKLLSSPVDSVIEMNESMSACVLVGDEVYFVSGSILKKYNLLTQEKSTITELSMTAHKAFLSDSGDLLYLFNTNDEVKKMIIYDIPAAIIDEATIPVTAIGKKIVYDSNIFAIGNSLIAEGSLYQISTNNSDIPVYLSDNLLFTSKYIINVDTNEYLAVFREDVSGIYIGSDYKTYIFYTSGRIDVISNSVNPATNYSPAKFRAAEINDTISAGSTKQSEYNSIGNIFSGRSISDFTKYGNWLYIICNNMPVLYKLDADTFIQVDEIPLRYLPKKVITTDNNLYISFKNSTYIYSANADTGDFGDYTSVGFVPYNLIVTNNKLVSVVETKVVIYDLSLKTFANTGKSANGVYAVNNTIFASSGSSIYIYDLNTYASKGSISTGSAISSFIISGDYLFNGGKAYSITTKKLIYNIGSSVLAHRGNTVFSASGVFDIYNGKYISSFTSQSLYHYLDESFNYYAVFENKITLIRSANGSDLTLLPEIKGIEQDKTYFDGINIEYAYGLGYVGTERIEKGSYFTEGGEQFFMLVLSCGITIQIEFYVVPAFEGIEILGGDRRMNVNETITLQAKCLPDGTTPVEVIFETKDIEIISIDANGNVTALKEGVAIVKAQTFTGNFSDECKITVSKTLIKFDPSKTYKVDRNKQLVTDVSAGTNVDEILDALTVEGEVEILDKNGNKTDGVIGTGMTIVLKNGYGDEIDKLTFSVLGDISGDGYISAEDLYCLMEILEGETYEKAFLQAADINKNGKVANGDMTELKAQLLYYGESIKINEVPPVSAVTNIFALINTKIYQNEKVIVTIQLDGALGTYAASGKLKFNSELMEYNKTTSQSWDFTVYEGEGFISFLSYNINKTGSTRNAKTILVMEFTLKEETLGKQVVFDLSDTITVSDVVSRTLPGSQTVRTVMQRENNDFNLIINNADKFTFSKDISEYNIAVKSDVAALDIEVQYPQGATVIISDTIIPESDYLEVRVIYTDPDNNYYVYIICVTREKEYNPDTNCYLESLLADGYDLSPAFDKDITEYTLTVPYETEQLLLSFKAESEKSLTEAINPILIVGTNTIKVTCVAENGDIKIYTITVTRENKVLTESSEPEISEDNPRSVEPMVYIVGISVLAVIAGILIIILLKRRKI